MFSSFLLWKCFFSRKWIPPFTRLSLLSYFFSWAFPEIKFPHQNLPSNSSVGVFVIRRNCELSSEHAKNVLCCSSINRMLNAKMGRSDLRVIFFLCFSSIWMSFILLRIRNFSRRRFRIRLVVIFSSGFCENAFKWMFELSIFHLFARRRRGKKRTEKRYFMIRSHRFLFLFRFCWFFFSSLSLNVFFFIAFMFGSHHLHTSIQFNGREWDDMSENTNRWQSLFIGRMWSKGCVRSSNFTISHGKMCQTVCCLLSVRFFFVCNFATCSLLFVLLLRLGTCTLYTCKEFNRKLLVT